MAGYKSLFAFWTGGAGSVAPSGGGGVKSLLAPWIGGASATSATNGGYRSLLAFWSGGAFGYDVVVPPVCGGNADSERYYERKRISKQVEKVIKSAQQVQQERISARKALKAEKLETRKAREREQEVQLFTESALLTEQIRQEIIRLGLIEASAQLAQSYMIRDQIEQYEKQIEEIDIAFLLLLVVSIDN